VHTFEHRVAGISGFLRDSGNTFKAQNFIPNCMIQREIDNICGPKLVPLWPSRATCVFGIDCVCFHKKNPEAPETLEFPMHINTDFVRTGLPLCGGHPTSPRCIITGKS
jgi:hypothetical protein